MKLIRVFPRRTKASPTDSLARFDLPDLFDEADRVHISVAFTWDLPLAERMAKHWGHVAQTTIGGPATAMRGGDFVPGLYLKPGYVITSRGCPNRCWFCSVWQREGDIRELSITDGWNVLDDNLLACSEPHIRAVFTMLKRQKHRPEFTGGLEATQLKPWHVDLLLEAKPTQMFFAYDTPDDYEPLIVAGRMLRDAGIKIRQCRAFVLIGYPGDSFEKAEQRCLQTVKAGFLPAAMLFRNIKGLVDPTWRRFQRMWIRPAATKAHISRATAGLPG